MQLTWLGTAGFRLETEEGAIILLDPFLSRPTEAYPILPLQRTDLFPVDEILLTHGRFDHAMDVPALVEQTGAIVHAPYAVCQQLVKRGLSVNRLQPVIFDHPKKVGNLHWQALPGHISQVDSSPSLRARLRDKATYEHVRALEQAWPVGDVASYFIEAAELSLLHFGSAGWNPAIIDDLKPEVLLLPIERSPQPEDNAVRLATLLRPKVIVPHHWDDYYPPLSEQIDLTPFETIIQAHLPQTKVCRPAIGQPFNPADLLQP